MKFVINPAYKIKRGKPNCNHKREKIPINGEIYEFCDECMVVYVY